MRVTLDHQTVRKGLVLKTTYYAVDLTLGFTHEEKQIIRQRNLTKTKLLDRRPATARVDDRDEKFELRVEHLLNGQTDRFLCATPSKAKIYEAQILMVMEQIKRGLDDNAKTIIDLQFTDIAKAFSNSRIRIEGNTDNVGSRSSNVELSRNWQDGMGEWWAFAGFQRTSGAEENNEGYVGVRWSGRW